MILVLTESERTDIQISQQQQRLKASTFYPVAGNLCLKQMDHQNHYLSN